MATSYKENKFKDNPANTQEHGDTKDTSATRILIIIKALCSGKRLDDLSLKDFDFNISQRTFQRDIKKIKDFFTENYANLQGGGGVAKTIQKFAALSGIKSLYPTLDEYFLAEFLDDNTNFIYNVTPTAYAQTSPQLFEELSSAILEHQCVSFEYKDKAREVKPYELSHIQGIWYLIADEKGMLKHFAFNKLTNVRFLDKHFTPKTAFITQLKHKRELWLSHNPKKAVLKIHPKAKEYFLRKPLPPNFYIIKDDTQGLLVRVSFAFDDELFKFVKTWLPYISIQEPQDLQGKFENILKGYLRGEVKGGE